MAKKKGIGRTRKKKPSTKRPTNAESEGGSNKRLKTEATFNDVKNELFSGIKAMIHGMNEDHLYSVMVYIQRSTWERTGSNGIG